MTQDEIFDAARKSHLDVYALGRDKSQFIYRLEAFAKLLEQHKVNQIADACAKLPFGDTAHSFALWIRAP